MGGQHRWAPAYLAACHHIYIIIYYIYYYLLWLIKLLLLFANLLSARVAGWCLDSLRAAHCA